MGGHERRCHRECQTTTPPQKPPRRRHRATRTRREHWQIPPLQPEYPMGKPFAYIGMTGLTVMHVKRSAPMHECTFTLTLSQGKFNFIIPSHEQPVMFQRNPPLALCQRVSQEGRQWRGRKNNIHSRALQATVDKQKSICIPLPSVAPSRKGFTHKAVAPGRIMNGLTYGRHGGGFTLLQTPGRGQVLRWVPQGAIARLLWRQTVALATRSDTPLRRLRTPPGHLA